MFHLGTYLLLFQCPISVFLLSFRSSAPTDAGCSFGFGLNLDSAARKTCSPFSLLDCLRALNQQVGSMTLFAVDC